MKSLKKPIGSLSAVLRETLEFVQQHAQENAEDQSVRMFLDGGIEKLLAGIYRQEDQDGDGKLTIELLEALIEILPKSPDLYRELVKTHMRAGDHKSAARYALKALDFAPNDTDLRFDLALCHTELGRHEMAIMEFYRYLESVKDYPWAYNNIGCCYRDLGQRDKAEQFLMMALSIDETFAPAYHNLAMLYHDGDEWEKCAYWANLGVRSNPSEKNLHLVLGEALMGLRNYKAGLEHLVTATLIDRDFLEAYESMPVAHIELGMYELAIGAAREALRLDPESKMAYEYWGRALSKQGKSQQAARKFEKAIELAKASLRTEQDPLARYSRCWEIGWSSFMTDQYDQALEFTKKALVLASKPEPELHFNKGLILAAQGQEEQSEAAYQEGLRMATIHNSRRAIGRAVGDIEEFVSTRARAEERDERKIAFLTQVKDELLSTMDPGVGEMDE